jgi:hypothetical protein
MKAINCFIIVVFCLCTIETAWAEDPVLPPSANRALIEQNLLVGLASENRGLQRSCALMLGHLGSEDAVLPLMAILKNSEYPELKIAAAWSLCNIGDPRGTFAVKREVEFNDCCKTRLACAWYYENMVKPGSFVFREINQQLVAIAQH